MISERTFLYLSTVIVQLCIVYFKPIRADLYIFGLVMITYFLELMPIMEAYQWHRRLGEVQEKLKYVSLELAEGRKKEVEEMEIEKRRKKKEIKEQRELWLKECTDPLEKCPKEIWVKILNLVEDPLDVESCYHTCRLFHSLLEIEMKAKAFMLLDNYMEKHSTTGGLEPQDILNCRLVCSTWKLSVDHFLQHNPAQMKFQGNCYPCTIIDSHDSRHVEGLIQRLINTYHHSNTNPFPSRHLLIKIQGDTTEDDRKIFHEAVTILLKYFGKHVWYFSIVANVGQKEVETYKQVYGFLGQTENVKMVDLSLTGVPKGRRTTKETRTFGTFLLRHEFPKLRNMQALKFDDCTDAIIDSALRRNRHLVRLEVYCSDSSHGWIRYRGMYPNLPMLTDCTLSNIRVPQVAELQNVNWPLTALTIEPGEGQRDPMDLKLLCTTIQKFAKSLKYLNFGTKWRSMANLRLALPHLEELEIHFEGKALMDFMLPMESLKVLKVFLYDERRYNDVHELEIVKFKDAVKTLHKSDTTNIWRLFPELNEVSISMVKRAGTFRKERTYMYYRHGDDVMKMVRNT